MLLIFTMFRSRPQSHHTTNTHHIRQIRHVCDICRGTTTQVRSSFVLFPSSFVWPAVDLCKTCVEVWGYGVEMWRCVWACGTVENTSTYTRRQTYLLPLLNQPRHLGHAFSNTLFSFLCQAHFLSLPSFFLEPPSWRGAFWVYFFLPSPVCRGRVRVNWRCVRGFDRAIVFVFIPATARTLTALKYRALNFGFNQTP